MILTDIAKRSDTIDKVCSFAQGAALIKHDLYFFDVFSGPDRLVNQIGKTKNQNVLDRFFGQIMIYAKNLFFLKQFRQNFENGLVVRRRNRQIKKFVGAFSNSTIKLQKSHTQTTV